jgi:hypothetical protein
MRTHFNPKRKNQTKTLPESETRKIIGIECTKPILRVWKKERDPDKEHEKRTGGYENSPESGVVGAPTWRKRRDEEGERVAWFEGDSALFWKRVGSMER